MMANYLSQLASALYSEPVQPRRSKLDELQDAINRVAGGIQAGQQIKQSLGPSENEVKALGVAAQQAEKLLSLQGPEREQAFMQIKPQWEQVKGKPITEAPTDDYLNRIIGWAVKYGAYQTEQDKQGKGRFIGQPDVVKDTEGNLFYQGLIEDETGKPSLSRIPIGEFQLTNKQGLNPYEESDLEVQTTGNKKRSELEARLEKEPMLEQQKEFAKRSGEDAAKTATDAYEQIQKINRYTKNLNDLKTALDNGANVGVVDRFLPSMKQATLEFENTANLLGLDLISSVTFGALSEKELELAMKTAAPQFANEAAARDWVEKKIAAQNKLKNYFLFIGKEASKGKTGIQIMLEMEDGGFRQASSGQPARQQAGSGPLDVGDGFSVEFR